MSKIGLALILGQNLDGDAAVADQGSINMVIQSRGQSLNDLKARCSYISTSEQR